MTDEEKNKKKSVKKKTTKKRAKKSSKPKLKSAADIIKESNIEKISPEPIISVKHEEPKKSKIISGVSHGVSDLLGLDVEIVRVLFLISFIFLIGIPIYLFLSLFIRD